MNIQSRPTLKKYITLLAIMLIYLPYSCKTVEREAHGLSVKNSNYSAPHGMNSYLTVVQQQVLH